jgi:hypothetical protein
MMPTNYFIPYEIIPANITYIPVSYVNNATWLFETLKCSHCGFWTLGKHFWFYDSPICYGCYEKLGK